MLPRSHRQRALSRAFAAVACCLALASAGGTELGRPIQRVFTPRIYGADAQNFCAAQDEAGLMYFGNTNGVLTFDGANWRTIRTGYSENIRAMVRGTDGNIYLGGVHQLGYVRPTETGGEYVSLLENLPRGDYDFSVFLRVAAQGDAVYFSTTKLLLVWRAGRFSVLPVENPSGNTIELYSVDREVWVNASGQPLRRVRGSTLEVAADGPFFRDHSICGLERETSGSLLIATDKAGLFRWRDGSATPMPTAIDDLLHGGGMFRMRRLRDGSFAVLLAAQRGTVFLDSTGGFLWKVDDDAGLPTRVVFDIAEDAEGGVWLCLANGLARLEWPSGFSLFDKLEGLPPSCSAIVRHNGDLFVGVHDGLYRLVPGDASHGNAHFEVVRKTGVWSLLSDPGGLLLTENGGKMFQLRREGPVEIPNDLKGATTLVRSRRDPRRIWVAGADGLASIYAVDGGWRNEGRVKELPTGTRTVAETPTGDLWTASLTEGLYRIRFGPAPANAFRGAPQVTHFAVGSHGLPDHHNTMRIYAWGDDVLAVMGSRGLWLLDAKTDSFRPLETTGPQLTEPNKLSLFLGTSAADHFWAQRDTNLPADLEVSRISRAGRPEVLPHFAADAAHFARVLVEEHSLDGDVLWVGGNDALLRVDVKRAFPPPPAIPLVLQAPDVAPDQKLTHDRRVIELAALAPVFRSGGSPEYRTRLVGFDSQWSNWSSDRKRVYTNLAPGHYTFEAMARDNDGQVSGVIRRAFTVQPPWWRTWWCIGLMSCSSITGVAGATRWFANRALKRRIVLLEAQSAVERERLRLARDLHDEVGSGLGRVILFAGEARRAKEDPTQLDAALDRVRDAAQELVQHAREIVWAVSPQHDSLASTVERLADYAEQTLRAAGIACRVEVPLELPPVVLGSEARHNVFLAVKEAVHNAVKYSEAPRAEFSVRIVPPGDAANGELTVELRDYGRGFAAGEQRGTGHGLKNLKARAAALGGQGEIVSVVGQGTTVTLRVPLREGGV